MIACAVTTKVLPFHYKNASRQVIDETVNSLKAGNLIITPTDTIYGIAASASFLEAEEKIFQVKKRDKGKPIPILISDLSQLKAFGVKMLNDIEKVLQAFWPGALTVILKCNNGREEGFRMPNHPLLLKLIQTLGNPIRATSANISGEEVASSAEEALKIFNGKVDIILDGGKVSKNQLPSTVIKIEQSDVKVIREGAISLSEIQEVLVKQ